jgi:O-antigen ligase
VISAEAAITRVLPGASIRVVVFGAGSAVLIGAAIAVNVAAGVGIAILVAVGIAAALRPVNILGVLIAAVFLELIKFQGVAVTRLIAPVALLVVLAAAVRKETAIRWSPPLAWAIAYAVWALASGLWTESTGGTTFALASLAIALVYMLAFGSLITTRSELNRVLYLFAVLSLILGVLSILSFTGRHPLGFTLTGEGRSEGGTGNPNYFAAIQVITLPMILVLAANEAKRWRLAFLVIVGLVNVGSVISTVSRGGMLSLVLVVALILLLPARTVFRTRGQKIAAVITILLAATVFVTRYSGDVVPRLTSVFGGSQATEAGSGRLAIWPVAWNEFQKHPATGIGFGAFVEVSIDRILGSPASQDFELPKTQPKEVHNAYLGSLTELGIPGLTLFLGLLVSTMLALRRTARRARMLGEHYVATVANALILSLAGWAVGSVFAESETARPRWIVIGICLALPKLLPSRSPDPASNAPRPS